MVQNSQWMQRGRENRDSLNSVFHQSLLWHLMREQAHSSPRNLEIDSGAQQYAPFEWMPSEENSQENKE
jgi:hypothetical protein